MVGNPDFFAGRGQDQGPEMQELETPEGELHLRFFLPSGDEMAFPAIGIREAIALAFGDSQFAGTSHLGGRFRTIFRRHNPPQYRSH